MERSRTGRDGLVELIIAVVSGSVGLLGDALHNLSDVSTSVVVFLGFRISRRAASERYPYGYERAEDLAGVGIAIVIWASAVLAGAESIHKLLVHGSTSHVGWGIAGAATGIIGNQVVARYKLRVGRRINSATLIAEPNTPGSTHSRPPEPCSALSGYSPARGGLTPSPGSSSPPSSAMSVGRSPATSRTDSWTVSTPTSSRPPRPG